MADELSEVRQARAIAEAEQEEQAADRELDAVLDELRLGLARNLRVGPRQLQDLFQRADAARDRRRIARERRHQAMLEAVLTRPSR